MLTLTLFFIIFGLILANYFKVFVLVPASLLCLFPALLKSGASLLSMYAQCALLLIALQAGYLSFFIAHALRARHGKPLVLDIGNCD